jgi:hypothetical protein
MKKESSEEQIYLKKGEKEESKSEAIIEQPEQIYVPVESDIQNQVVDYGTNTSQHKVHVSNISTNDTGAMTQQHYSYNNAYQQKSRHYNNNYQQQT